MKVAPGRLTSYGFELRTDHLGCPSVAARDGGAFLRKAYVNSEATCTSTIAFLVHFPRGLAIGRR